MRRAGPRRGGAGLAAAAAAVLGLHALAACEHHGPIAGMPSEEPAQVIARAPARPAWWHDGIETDPEAGTMSVCAEADGPDLLGARRAAVAIATTRFRAVTGVDPVHPTILADSGRLPGGAYRAFVRLSGTVAAPGKP